MDLAVVSLDQTGTSVGIVLAVLGIISAVLAHYRVVRPWWRKFKGDLVTGRDVIIGRPPIVDPVSKKKIADSLPSLGERLEVHGERLEANGERLELHQSEISGTLKKVVSLLESQQAQDSRLNDHEERIGRLEVGVFERAVARADSTAAFRAIEAVANGNGIDDAIDVPDDSPELD